MIALLTACLFFEILVHVLNCISESGSGHLKLKLITQNVSTSILNAFFNTIQKLTLGLLCLFLMLDRYF